MFPELNTRRLTLRRLEPSDVGQLYTYRSDPEVSRYQSWEPASAQEVRAFIERLRTMDPLTPGEWFQVGIALRDTGELIGDCGLHVRADDRRQVEIGITLAPRFQRQGLAAEALQALLDFLFTRTDTHRVFCSVDPRNQACVRLLAKVGMRQEAHLVESLWFKGAWADDLVFAMLRRESGLPGICPLNV
jgi:RimJ/RimL family protein N-acetyltransferase